jgi:hypothetical protein
MDGIPIFTTASKCAEKIGRYMMRVDEYARYNIRQLKGWQVYMQ